MKQNCRAGGRPSKSLFRRFDLAMSALILPIVVVPSAAASPSAPAAPPTAPVTTAASVTPTTTVSAAAAAAAASASSMLVAAPSTPTPLPSAVGVLGMIILLIVMSRLVTAVVILLFPQRWRAVFVIASTRRFFRTTVLHIARRHRRLVHRLRIRILKVSGHQFYQLRDVIFGASHYFVEKNLKEMGKPT